MGRMMRFGRNGPPGVRTHPVFDLVAARDLATYLIPGCVGTGVRLGSEGSSVGGGVGGGGVWKSGNLS